MVYSLGNFTRSSGREIERWRETKRVTQRDEIDRESQRGTERDRERQRGTERDRERQRERQRE